MEKKFEVLPPSMPNFVSFKKKAGLRQDGFKVDEGFPIKDFTMDEAYGYAELMKQTFIKHWEAKQTNGTLTKEDADKILLDLYNVSGSLRDRLFELANDFAVAKQGEVAVKLHSIHNGLQ